MSSAGHVLDMIKRSRYNESLRMKRIQRIQNIKEAYQEEVRKNHPIDTHEVALSEDELRIIRHNIRASLQKGRTIKRVFIILSTVVISVLFYYLFIDRIQIY